ncbi:LysM peptidoglycan-binding domain-containing protein [Paenibacillus tengchongensis]|uniref:LysM peptidoglycan-binding domain-containing protein n=1 Tax=Paenibacillus tengchongensis TaxID=2608684 RepID=UPI00124F40DC|nr:LysM peptidoglycan-binding domain-containing protein [Paenibacillus tengchongensis]
MLKYSTYRSIYEESNAGNQSAKVSPRDRKHSGASTPKLMRVLRQAGIMKLSLVLLLVISGFAVVGNVFAGSVSMLREEKRIVVESGDTLWSIALENKPSKMDTAVYIEGIKHSSGLTNNDIMAGDVLSLPVY